MPIHVDGKIAVDYEACNQAINELNKLIYGTVDRTSSALTSASANFSNLNFASVSVAPAKSANLALSSDAAGLRNRLTDLVRETRNWDESYASALQGLQLGLPINFDMNGNVQPLSYAELVEQLNMIDLLDKMQIEDSIEREHMLRLVALLNTLRTENGFNWDRIEEILGRPSDQISELEYHALASVFAEMSGATDVERFINLIAEQFAPAWRTQQGTLVPGQYVWLFCAEKAGNIRRYLDAGVTDLIAIQMGLSQDCAAHHNVSRHHLMSRSTLLYVVGGLTPVDADPHALLVPLGGANGPLSVEAHDGTGFRLGFTQATKVMTTMVGVAPGLNTNDIPNSQGETFILQHLQNRTIMISGVYGTVASGVRYRRITREELLRNHDFNAIAHVAQTVGESLLGRAAAVIPFGEIGFEVLSAIGSISSAQRQAERVKMDIDRAFESAYWSDAFRTFSIETIFVHDDLGRVGGVGRYTTNMWPTAGTDAGLRAMNHYAGTQFRLEDFCLQTVFVEHSNLSPQDYQRVYFRANEQRTASP